MEAKSRAHHCRSQAFSGVTLGVCVSERLPARPPWTNVVEVCPVFHLGSRWFKFQQAEGSLIQHAPCAFARGLGTVWLDRFEEIVNRAGQLNLWLLPRLSRGLGRNGSLRLFL